MGTRPAVVATGNQILASEMNAVIAAMVLGNSGNYTGNSSANRTIPHGLGETPKAVIILCRSAVNSPGLFMISDQGAIIQGAPSEDVAFSTQAVTAMDATNFHVGNAGSYPSSANETAKSYYWIALA